MPNVINLHGGVFLEDQRRLGKVKMDSTFRIMVKGVSWQALGILSMTLLSYLHTGSFVSALSIASSAAVSSFVFFFAHEKIWNRVRWGRLPFKSD